MIVVDASAVTELLLQTERGAAVEERIYRKDDDLHAPHLLDVEILSALRRLVRDGEISAGRAGEALEDLSVLRIVRHAHAELLDRAWHLRKSLTAYDAMYVALAESLDAVLLTCDGPLAATPGHGVRIDLIRIEG
jgi:predicted nucleic acid-binding protein